jgi:hypothetical protein
LRTEIAFARTRGNDGERPAAPATDDPRWRLGGCEPFPSAGYSLHDDSTADDPEATRRTRDDFDELCSIEESCRIRGEAMNSVSYGPYWTPAVVVMALLTLMVVPFLSLIVFMIGLLAAATAVVAVAVRVVAAAPNLARAAPERATSLRSGRRPPP